MDKTDIIKILKNENWPKTFYKSCYNVRINNTNQKVS